MLRIARKEKGDTLVEVMLATAVLSLVLAGAFSISNKATRFNQNANERTQVSNLIQREAELIRASFRDDPGNLWGSVDTLDTTINPNYCDLATGHNAINTKAFYMDDSLNVNIVPGTPLTGDDATADNFLVWVEATQDTVNAAPRFTDFYVYACWDGIGGEGIQRTGLVMRLAR